ncbi:MAG: DUF2277 domain-containing protein [Anaerolineae bacterium]|nr:DUF2277 domain-containing protein [Anaerolineae bacterium]
MCRNIQPLFNMDPPVSDEEIRLAALQYVRKISGYHHPSSQNQETFDAAVAAIANATGHLLTSLQTQTPVKNRAELAAKRKARSLRRFAQGGSS